MTSSVATDSVRAILEFDKIVEATAGMCLTAMGAEEIRRRQPTGDVALIDRRREELGQMLLVLAGGSFPLVRLPDIRPHIERSLHEGAFLDAAALLQVREFLSGVDALLRFAKVSAEKFPGWRRI